jgi:AAA+ superfamily predicted ATPase
VGEEELEQNEKSEEDNSSANADATAVVTAQFSGLAATRAGATADAATSAAAPAIPPRPPPSTEAQTPAITAWANLLPQHQCQHARPGAPQAVPGHHSYCHVIFPDRPAPSEVARFYDAGARSIIEPMADDAVLLNGVILPRGHVSWLHSGDEVVFLGYDTQFEYVYELVSVPKKAGEQTTRYAPQENSEQLHGSPDGLSIGGSVVREKIVTFGAATVLGPCEDNKSGGVVTMGTKPHETEVTVNSAPAKVAGGVGAQRRQFEEGDPIIMAAALLKDGVPGLGREQARMVLVSDDNNCSKRKNGTTSGSVVHGASHTDAGRHLSVFYTASTDGSASNTPPDKVNQVSRHGASKDNLDTTTFPVGITGIGSSIEGNVEAHNIGLEAIRDKDGASENRFARRDEVAYLAAMNEADAYLDANYIRSQAINVSFDSFPYCYLSNDMKEFVVSWAYGHLKHRGLTTSMQHAISPPKLLLEGPNGTELYLERFVYALAHHFGADLLVFDIVTLSNLADKLENDDLEFEDSTYVPSWSNESIKPASDAKLQSTGTRRGTGSPQQMLSLHHSGRKCADGQTCSSLGGVEPREGSGDVCVPTQKHGKDPKKPDSPKADGNLPDLNEVAGVGPGGVTNLHGLERNAIAEMDCDGVQRVNSKPCIDMLDGFDGVQSPPKPPTRRRLCSKDQLEDSISNREAVEGGADVSDEEGTIEHQGVHRGDLETEDPDAGVSQVAVSAKTQMTHPAAAQSKLPFDQSATAGDAQFITGLTSMEREGDEIKDLSAIAANTVSSETTKLHAGLPGVSEARVWRCGDRVVFVGRHDLAKLNRTLQGDRDRNNCLSFTSSCGRFAIQAKPSAVHLKSSGESGTSARSKYASASDEIAGDVTRTNRVPVLGDQNALAEPSVDCIGGIGAHAPDSSRSNVFQLMEERPQTGPSKSRGEVKPAWMALAQFPRLITHGTTANSTLTTARNPAPQTQGTEQAVQHSGPRIGDTGRILMIFDNSARIGVCFDVNISGGCGLGNMCEPTRGYYCETQDMALEGDVSIGLRSLPNIFQTVMSRMVERMRCTKGQESSPSHSVLVYSPDVERSIRGCLNEETPSGTFWDVCAALNLGDDNLFRTELPIVLVGTTVPSDIRSQDRPFRGLLIGSSSAGKPQHNMFRESGQGSGIPAVVPSSSLTPTLLQHFVGYQRGGASNPCGVGHPNAQRPPMTIESVFNIRIMVETPQPDASLYAKWTEQMAADMSAMRIKRNQAAFERGLNDLNLSCDDVQNATRHLATHLLSDATVKSILKLAVSLELMARNKDGDVTIDGRRQAAPKGHNVVVGTEKTDMDLCDTQASSARSVPTTKPPYLVLSSGAICKAAAFAIKVDQSGDVAGSNNNFAVGIRAAAAPPPPAAPPPAAPPPAPPPQEPEPAPAPPAPVVAHAGQKEITVDNEFEHTLLGQVVFASEIGVKFEDIGGLDSVKAALQEVVILPLRRPGLFRKGNLSRPTKGVLLFGPPGTGKTMMAKAVATEAGAQFINLTMSSIASKWLGDGENYVRGLFSVARKLAPVVIFVDEADALLGQRKEYAHEHDAVRKVKNEFMLQWDGLLSKATERVLVLGSSNRPFDLDEAVLRRFQRRLLVDLPDAASRGRILRVLTAQEDLGADVDLGRLAASLEGYSGSDLRNLCAEAAMAPIREIMLREELPLLPRPRKERVGAEQEEQEEQEEEEVRPLCMADFEAARATTSASVSEGAASVVALREWNETCGESGSRKKAVLPYFT